MDSRTNSRNIAVSGMMSRDDSFQGRIPEKNLYSEPSRNLMYQSGSYKPKIGYKMVDMYDDDPGIMSEAETSSTGFRRGGKIRSSLPVVRTPSKTLERPLGLVFLQYRNETKRALLPNEITSIDTVRALFVRSFCKQLTMEYLDAMGAKIYIHDSAKDMFYELEDLRDIRDRSVLRLFEPNINGNGATPTWNDQDQYFSEPEFDTDFPNVHHIHKSKPLQKPLGPGPATYSTYSLPRHLTSRAFSPAASLPSPAHSMMSGHSGGGGRGPPGGPPAKPVRHSQQSQQGQQTQQQQGVNGRGRPTTPSSPLYSPRSTGSGNTFLGIRTSSEIYATTGETYSPEKLYETYGSIAGSAGGTRSGAMTPVFVDDESRYRMEHMERQLANLTGLVQKALHPPTVVQPNRLYNPRMNYRDYIPVRDFRDDIDDKNSSSSSASLPDEPILLRPEILPQSQSVLNLQPTKAARFGKEKSVSFSDDPQELLPRGGVADIGKPTKPAIKSSTLPRMTQGDRGLSLPPIAQSSSSSSSQTGVVKKPGLSVVPGPPTGAMLLRTELSPELFNQLRALQKKAKELKVDLRMLRRHVQAQAHTLRDNIRDTFLKFKVIATLDDDLLGFKEPRLRREEDMYKMEVNKLDKDIAELEKTVEDLRTHVINRRAKVNMADVENMALILSKSSKNVADLKARFPVIQENVARALTLEMDRLSSEERFLKTEPDRLENALRRCKKLTGTLVTLKRLASVQEQRVPIGPDPGPIYNTVTQLQQGNETIVDAAKNSNRKSFSAPGGGGINGVYYSGGVAPGGSSNGGLYIGAATTTPPFGSPSGLGNGYGDGTNETLDELLDELKLSGGGVGGQALTPEPSTNNAPQTNMNINNNNNNNNTTSTNTTTTSTNKVHRLRPPSPPRRLPSYPSTESGGGSPVHSPHPLPPSSSSSTNQQQGPPSGGSQSGQQHNKYYHPPVPPKPTKVPPPPPPRTSSKHSPNLIQQDSNVTSSSLSESSDSVNSQDVVLNQRHLELLRKQKQLQEQFNRLQTLQHVGSGPVPKARRNDQSNGTAGDGGSGEIAEGAGLKKTGSESNIRQKLSFAPSGSVGNLGNLMKAGHLYETDIL